MATTLRRLRVSVERWDESFITLRPETSTTVLRMAVTDTWRYLLPMLCHGRQMNLVNARREGDVVVPELVIVEPDYLADISAIAACFETYNQTGFVHLLNKLRSVRPTSAILLGNFESQLLDETLHGWQRPYAESIREFFRRNGLAMAACADLTPDFHTEAKAQQDNVQKAISTTLTQEETSFRADQVLLEPSFVCELLGIQGRMDFLQASDSLMLNTMANTGTTGSQPHEARREVVLIEQKSGKGAYPFEEFVRPRHTKRHHVQLLLYQALLHYNFGIPQTDIHAYLLYSKYRQSLLRPEASPALLHEALRVRNELAWHETEYAQGHLQQLETLTPEHLNTCGTRGKLWEQYTRPQLAALLDPIQQATPLERAYFMRMLAFVEREQLLSKMGDKGREIYGFASAWTNSLDEKRLAGSIFEGLRMEAIPQSADVLGEITLLLPEGHPAEATNFRPGDIVMLYAYEGHHEPDLRQTIVFRSTIVAILADRLRIRLRNPQTHPQMFATPDNYLWAIEHDFFESSTTSLYRGLHALLTASAERRGLLLSQRPPRQDTTLGLRSHDHGDEFSRLALRARQARDFLLVIGPPGTGKTSFGLMGILHEELMDATSTVLLLSFTNRAVDEICSKLVEADIDFIRLGNELTCSADYHSHLLSTRIDSCRNITDVRQLLAQTRVFCATTASMNANTSLLAIKRFSLAIVDEASQILEPHLMGLLCARCGKEEAIGRFVLIGDHRQLPAVVQQSAEESAVSDPLLRAIGLTDCRRSLFERLLSRHRDDPGVVFTLHRQGRMHPLVADFANRVFYDNQLDIVPLSHQLDQLPTHCTSTNGLERLLHTHRFAFIATPQPHEPSALSSNVPALSDKTNAIEAQMMAATAVAVYRLHTDDFRPDRTIGIIVPYRNQIATVRHAIDGYAIDGLRDITIDTVERFQGSQREIILYGFTVQKRYQLDFLTSNNLDIDGTTIDRKLNVAMTRARRQLFLFGNSALLAQAPVFAHLISYARDHHALLSPPTADDYCTGHDIGLKVCSIHSDSLY